MNVVGTVYTGVNLRPKRFAITQGFQSEIDSR